MSYTAGEIADEVWTHTPRTTDGQAAGASNGTILDDIAYAAWTYGTRTLDAESHDCVARGITLGALEMESPTPGMVYACVPRGILLGALEFGKPTCNSLAPTAASWVGQVVKFEIVGDALSVAACVQKVMLVHTDPAEAILTDREGNEIATLQTTLGRLTASVDLASGVIADGLRLDHITGGTLFVYLAP